MSSRATNVIVSMSFLFLVGCSGLVFALRIGTGEFGSKAFLATPTGRLVLCGGASEIGGTPNRPKDFRKRIEWETTQNFPIRIVLLEFGASFERLIGWNVPLLAGSSKPFRIGKGFLGRSKYRQYQFPARRPAQMRHLLGLADWFQKRGIPVLYVRPPSRLRDDDVLFQNVFDFTDEFDACLSESFRASGVPVLDLAAEAVRSGLDPHTMFYATDHHFTASTAHWAAGAIADKLLGLGVSGFSPDPPEGAQWTETSRSVPFLGSIGKRSTLAWCRPEELWFPKLKPEGSYSIEHEDFKGQKTIAEGGFDVLLDGRKAKSRGHLYREDPYDAFSHGSGRFVMIANHGLSDAPRIVFVADSFDNALICFLAARCAAVASLDGRNGDVSLETPFRHHRWDAAVLFFSNPPWKLMAATNRKENKQ